MESASELVPFPLLQTPIESNYRACTIPYRFPSDNPRKATPSEIAWVDLFLNSIPSFKQRAETDPTVTDAPVRAQKSAERFHLLKYSVHGTYGMLRYLRTSRKIQRVMGARLIAFHRREEMRDNGRTGDFNYCSLNDAIEDRGKRLENLVRGIFAGNIFDLGSAQVG
ncbi:hypothetical protein Patl1_35940 [Pistacia atlantica]|nr:hypothetical protein Patl1_35940 [Pistacia atlantica]